MSTFFTSDTHIGHANIARYTGRPFNRRADAAGTKSDPGDVAEMNEAIVAMWNRMVAPGDTVHLAGDLCMGQIEISLETVERLNGELVVYAGNHDKVLGRSGADLEHWETLYLAAGVDHIVYGPSTVDIGIGQPVTIGHFPPPWAEAVGVDKYAQWRPVDVGQPIIHGHLHGNWRKRGNLIDVGMDAWGGQLVPAETIAALFEDGPEYVAPIPWTAAA